MNMLYFFIFVLSLNLWGKLLCQVAPIISIDLEPIFALFFLKWICVLYLVALLWILSVVINNHRNFLASSLGAHCAQIPTEIVKVYLLLVTCWDLYVGHGGGIPVLIVLRILFYIICVLRTQALDAAQYTSIPQYAIWEKQYTY